MADYFKSRWQHSLECWRHAKSHRVVGVAIGLGALYTAYTTWGPLVDLPDVIKPDRLPKVPLPWALVVILAST
jgi:hypothetical protein